MLTIVFLLTLLFLPLITFAQETFVPLTQGGVPGVETGTSFSDFLNSSFNFGLALAALLAVIMITIGGFEYMGSESVFKKGEGRERIKNAVIGLILALLIYLILFTINPNLLKFDVTFQKVKLDKGSLEDPLIREARISNMIQRNIDQKNEIVEKNERTLEEQGGSKESIVNIPKQGEGEDILIFKDRCNAVSGNVVITSARGVSKGVCVIQD